MQKNLRPSVLLFLLVGEICFFSVHQNKLSIIYVATDLTKNNQEYSSSDN